MKHKIPTLFCLLFAVFVNISITAHAQGVNKQDSLALVDLYNSTNGPNWNYHTNWLTKRPVSTWGGIIVSGKRVILIDLFDNNLIAQIPYSIGNLTALKE